MDWVLSRHWFFCLLHCLLTFLFQSAETISVCSLPCHHLCLSHFLPFSCLYYTPYQVWDPTPYPTHLPVEELLLYIMVTYKVNTIYYNPQIGLKTSLLLSKKKNSFWPLSIATQGFLFRSQVLKSHFRYITSFSRTKRKCIQKTNFNVNVSHSSRKLTWDLVLGSSNSFAFSMLYYLCHIRYIFTSYFNTSLY